MKKLIEYLKNCWKIEDLRQRLLITLLFTAIYRFGSFVVLPGINPAMLSKLQSQTSGGLMSLLDMFSGGAFSNASIFALGIMPYISASIVMQLLAVAVPYFQKMQREGESGRKKINWYTRIHQLAAHRLRRRVQSALELAGASDSLLRDGIGRTLHQLRGARGALEGDLEDFFLRAGAEERMSLASASPSSATSERSFLPPSTASLNSASFSRGTWMEWFLPSDQYWRL